MAKQTFTAGQVLTAAQVNALQTNDFNLTVTTQTGNYTLVAADKGTREVANSASPLTFTVNNSVFTAGDIVEIHNIGAGLLTIAAGAGVTINSADVLTVSQWQGGTLYFTSASAAIWFPRAKTATITPRIGQVVNTIKTDAFTTTSTSYVDITGYSVTITPTSTSSRILVLTGLALSSDNNSRASVTLLRGSTAIADSTGFATTNQTSAALTNIYLSQYVAISYLDSPATTSATTYKMQLRVGAGGGTGYINSQYGSTTHGNVSTITVMEYLP